MTAVRFIVLLLMLSTAGVALIRSGFVRPDNLSIVAPALADPQATAPLLAPPSAQPTGQPNAANAKSDSNLPSFVPGHQSLSFSSDNEGDASEPDGSAMPLPADMFAAMAAGVGNTAIPGSAAITPTLSAAVLSVGQTASSSEAQTAAAAPPLPPTNSPGARVVAIKVEPLPGMGVTITASLNTSAASKEPPKVIGAKNLFGAAKTPAPLAARAIGTYARGCLSGAVALPIDGPAWQEMRLSRNRNWGHPKLIALVEQFAKDAQKLDNWPGLLVGDIAQPRGGPMLTGHASHQVGLDADIWLTPMPNRRLTTKEREDLEATSMLDKTEVAVDPKVFTDKQVALIKRATSYPEVERVLVHPAIKKALCLAAGTDRKWLGKVRPYYGHYYHMHVRIKCPQGFGGCTPQNPPTGDDGCGKEVDQWLAKVVPPKTPAPPPPPGYKPPPSIKAPIMLSELPAECQAVLKAGPNPVKIPPEALMSPAAVRKALVKAAANAKAAAAAPVSKTAAAGTPVVPDPPKTAAADKK